MACQLHDWKLTGRVDVHIRGGVPDLFKYGHRPVAFVRCAVCRQDGFRVPGSRVVYTWERE